MASLIITIISLAIFAVAAVSAIYYGGQALENNSAQARAAAMLNEVHQIYAAATQYELDHGLSAFGSDFSLTDIQAAGGYLPTLPAIAGIAPNWGAYGLEENCSSPMDGEWVMQWRGICQINGQNVVHVYLADSGVPPVSGNPGATCNTFSTQLNQTTSASLPVVKMALAINAKMGLPLGLALSNSGIPNAPDGSPTNCQTDKANDVSTGGRYFSGSSKFNYCYIGSASGYAIICDFTD